MAKPLPGIIIALFFFCIFLGTMEYFPGEKDTAAIQYCSYTLGLLHPTGYPLIIFIGRGLTFLPLGNLASRVNLLSALSSSIAIFLLFFIFAKILKRPSSGVLGAVILGASESFWKESIHAEVYSLNLALILLFLYLLFKQEEKSSIRRNLILWFVFGLMLTNHLTALVVLPLLLWVILKNFKKYNLKLFLLSSFIFLLPLSLYLVVLKGIAQLGIKWFSGEMLRRFFEHITARQFHHLLFIYPLPRLTWRLSLWGFYLNRNFTSPVLFLSLIGLIWGLIKNFKITFFILVIWFIQFMFAINYGACDIEVFFLPANMVIVFLASFGFIYLRETVLKKAQILSWVLLFSLSFAALINIFQKFAANKMPIEYSLYEKTRKELNRVPAKARFVYEVLWESYWTRLYLNRIMRWRDDLALTPLAEFDVKKAIRAERRIYFDASARALPPSFIFERKGGEVPAAQLKQFLEEIEEGKLIVMMEKNEFKRVLHNYQSRIEELLGVLPGLLGDERSQMVCISIKGAEPGAATRFRIKNFKTITLKPGTKIGHTGAVLPVELKIESAAFDMGNFCYLEVDSRPVFINLRGMNVLVLDAKTGQIEKMANFDTHSGLFLSLYQLMAYARDDYIEMSKEAGQVFYNKFMPIKGEICFNENCPRHYLLEGWSKPENWGVWAIGNKASMAIYLEPEFNYQIFLTALPFLGREKRQSIKISVNSYEVGSFVFEDEKERTFTAKIPSEYLTPWIDLFIFEFGHSASPKSLGISDDNRELAVGFVKLKFMLIKEKTEKK